MRTSNWFLSSPELLGKEFYNGPAYKSYFFVLDFLLLVVAAALNVFVLAVYWGELSSFSRFWLVVNAVFMASLWLLAVRNRRRIQELYALEHATPDAASSSLDTSLRLAATIVHMGLFYSFGLLAGLLNLIAIILQGRR